LERRNEKQKYPFVKWQTTIVKSVKKTGMDRGFVFLENVGKEGLKKGRPLRPGEG